jgi:hypothetical protein
VTIILSKKDIERIAMAIVNNTNEMNNVPIDIRQKNNDKCFDYAIEQIDYYIKSNINNGGK